MQKDYERVTAEQERLKKQFEQEDEKAIDAEINQLLESRSGRILLWWLLGLGNLGANPFTSNALTTSFNCGQLNVSQKLLSRLTSVNPAGYARLVQEQFENGNRRDTSIATAGDSGDTSE